MALYIPPKKLTVRCKRPDRYCDYAGTKMVERDLLVWDDRARWICPQCGFFTLAPVSPFTANSESVAVYTEVQL